MDLFISFILMISSGFICFGGLIIFKIIIIERGFKKNYNKIENIIQNLLIYFIIILLGLDSIIFIISIVKVFLKLLFIIFNS